MPTFNFKAKLKLNDELKKSLDTLQSPVDIEIECCYAETDLEIEDEIVIEDIVVIYEDDDIVDLLDQDDLHSIILAKYKEKDWLED